MARRTARTSQLSLFGEPAADRVGPAPVADRLRELAARLPAELRLGTSSWSFPGWAGVVYDREATAAHLARHGLAAYARHPLLRAVGLDRTYYAPLSDAEFRAYAAVVPEEFRFVVKAASGCTDPFTRTARGRAAGRNELFLDAAFAAEQVVGPCVEGLGRRAGALLFQFPPQGSAATADPARFAESLARFLTGLPRGPVYAVELRDRELFARPYVEALRDAGAVHCYTAHPRMPSIGAQRERIGRQAMLVARWMLHPALGYEAARERYEPFSRIVDEDRDTRVAMAELCLEQIAGGGTGLVTANNKAEGSAPETLFRLAGEIVERHRERAQRTSRADERGGRAIRAEPGADDD